MQLLNHGCAIEKPKQLNPPIAATTPPLQQLLLLHISRTDDSTSTLKL